MSRRSVQIVLGLAIVATVALFFVHFHLVGFCIYGDGIGYYAPLRSAIFDGDLAVHNEYEHYATMQSSSGGGARWSHTIPQYSKYTVGLPLVLLPFVILGHLSVLLLNALHLWSIPANGLTWPYEIFYGFGSLAIGILGLVYSYKACRLFADRRSSLVATVGVWFGTALFYYLAIESSMSHAVSQGLVSVYLYYWLCGDWLKSKPHALFLGLLLGLATIVRPQNGFFATTVLVSVLWRPREVKRTWVSASLVASVVGLFVAIQFGVYLLVYGSVTGSPYMIEGNHTAGASFLWLKPQVWNVLFSGHRGLFIWHPIALAGCIGLLRLMRQKREEGMALVLALAMQVYLVAAWHCWWQGASFGSRMLSNCTLIFAVGSALVWTRFQSRHVWLPWILSGVLIVWNMLLLVQYRSGMIPPERPVSIRTLVVNQSTVIPYFYRHLQGQGKDTNQAIQRPH